MQPLVELRITLARVFTTIVEGSVETEQAILREHTDELALGLKRLSDLVPHARIWLTVRRELQGWARERFGDRAEIVGLSGAFRHRLERLVIPRITGVDVPNTEAFRSYGLAVLSTEHALTALAALEGRPFTRKTITVGGAGLAEPRVVRVPLGTRVCDVLAALGVEASPHGRVVIGGPMMGQALADVEDNAQNDTQDDTDRAAPPLPSRPLHHRPRGHPCCGTAAPRPQAAAVRCRAGWRCPGPPLFPSSLYGQRTGIRLSVVTFST